MELDDNIEGNYVAYDDRVNSGTTGSAPCAHLPTNISSDSLLNNTLQDDVVENVSQEDDLVHAPSAGDSVDISCKDLPERTPTASASKEGLNKDVSKGILLLGYFTRMLMAVLNILRLRTRVLKSS